MNGGQNKRKNIAQQMLFFLQWDSTTKKLSMA